MPSAPAAHRGPRSEDPGPPATGFAPVGQGADEAGVPVPILALTKSTGGIALYHRALVAGLSPDAYAVHTLCLSDGAEAYAAGLRATGHTAEALSMARYRIDPIGDLRVLWQAVAAGRKIGARLLLCHGSKAGVIGRAAGWWLGRPVLYCQASTPFLPRVQGRKAPLYRWIEATAARLFGGHVVALTETARQASITHGIARPRDVSTIRTGIDTDRFRPTGRRAAARGDLGLDPDTPVILWMGRFERQKAPGVFLDALALLAATGCRARVLMVGEGGDRPALEARIRAPDLSGLVRLLPWAKDPAALMEAADILCLSSRWEGLPLVLLEGMAMGLVPVSTAVDGCAEVIEAGRNGWLVPTDDPAALAGALAEALSDPARLRRMSAAARSRIEDDFAVGRMMADWRALIARHLGAEGD